MIFLFNMAFQTSSTIESVSTRKDGTIKITVGTQELEPTEMAELMNLHNKLGWFLFAESEIQDIPEAEPEFKNEKSLSKRLRDVLWIFWNNNTNKKKDFNTFRREWMEKKIQDIKDSLPE